VVLRLDAVVAGAAGLCDALYENKAMHVAGGVAGGGQTRAAPSTLGGICSNGQRHQNLTWTAAPTNIKSHIYRRVAVSGLSEPVQEVGTRSAVD